MSNNIQETITNNADANAGLANASTKKKIGFFSAMMVVVGSSVGAGIFFKAGNVLNNSQGSVIFAIFCWLLAAFAVICMSLALVEIASARNDNLSMIGWCKTFNSRLIYKACKNFMVYIYLPLTYFFMPLYVVMSFQDAFMGFTQTETGTLGGTADWAVAMVIALAMSVYFIVVSGISSKAGNIQNWVITSVKFLPLVFCAIIGFVIVGIDGFQGQNAGLPALGDGVGFVPEKKYDSFSFASLSPGIGMFIAVGAIFFAYDGFYVTAGIQSEMKEPKKTPIAILVGMIIVTVIYLFIAVSMSIGSSSGNPFGIGEWLKGKGLSWLYGTLQLTIAIGVLGIINGFSMWAPRFVEDLIREGELPFSKRYLNKLNDNKPWVGIIYCLVISLPIVILFCIIGGLGYINSPNYLLESGVSIYGDGMAKLYGFADLMGTWTAVLAFAFIVFAIQGGLKNRKTNAIKTEKTKYFVITGWLSVIFVGVSLFFTFIEPFINLFLLYNLDANTQTKLVDELVGRILVVVVFFLFLGLMVIPTIIEDQINIKKYGSIENANRIRSEEFNQILNLNSNK